MNLHDPQDCAARLIALGAGYDRDPRFPTDSLAILASTPFHRRFAPEAAGGERFDHAPARAAAMDGALRFVGRCDLSVGRLYEGHVNALQLFAWYATDAQARWLNAELDRGAWFGVWATEPPPGTTLDDGVLHGGKSFASGAGGLDYAVVTAAMTDGPRRTVVVPANDIARTDTSGWRVRGMRASVSGTYDLSGLAIDPLMMLGEPGDYDRDPRFTGGAWRFCAVQLGGVEALLAEMRAGMSDVAKADPVQRARFADAVVTTRTAGFWVAEAARRMADEDTDAPTIARMARGVVERAGLDVMENAARALGTRSAFDGQRADKIIRDLSLYLRQAGPDHARDEVARAFLDRDCWIEGHRLW